MPKDLLTPEEELRIARLRAYEILDTGKDPLLDRITASAATVCETPFALISLVDRNRQWFKSAQGLSFRETDRKSSICSHAILTPESPLIVTDLTKDPRFAANSLVTGDPSIRFYAGIPLVDEMKTALGTLCVFDRKPRSLTEQQLSTLRMLSGIAMERIKGIRESARVSRLLHVENEVFNRLLHSTSEIYSNASDLESGLSYLLRNLDPRLGWISARIRNLQTGGSCTTHDNASLETDPEIPGLWAMIDDLASGELGPATRIETVRLKNNHASYMHMMIPVMMRGKTLAQIDLIFPTYHHVDHGIKEAFELMASSISIIAERELITLELKRQATHDPLTGAANRTLILDGIKRALQECNPLEPDAIILFFDVDGFKEVNDNFGHDSGDRLLQEITRRLQGVCREKDILGRLSGDEFVLLARDIDVEGGLASLLERIQRNLSTPYMLGDLEIRVHSSIGCAVIAQSNVAPNEILRRAEEAMYLVKNGERRGFCIADEQVVTEFKARRLLERNVKQAFRDGGTFALFQPIVDLRTGSYSGCETLVRLRCRDGAVMSGRDFIPVIHRSRFQIQLDEYAFAETLRCFRSREGARLLENPSFRFAVNVSAAYLTTGGYAENCLRALEEASIPASSLCIEITECMVIPTEKTVIRNLTLLRERGVSVALDDFGTGYSNLKQLADFPIDLIKIDREFVTGVAEGNMTKNSLLGAMLGIAKNLGYEILAEGVETQVQADYLKSIGCDYAQGYLYGKPMPIGELLGLIGDGAPLLGTATTGHDRRGSGSFTTDGCGSPAPSQGKAPTGIVRS